MANKKQYGLILPKKNQLSVPKTGNIFGNDDDSEEEEGTDWVKKALKAENEKNKIKKQTQLNMQKALKEDPTIFQYDEVYDKIERLKEEKQSIKKVDKKAKYIDNLLKTADLRKKEQELRQDRIIQKEIEAEDAMFPDKERYVTSSYKAKLEEMKKFEEQQENQDRLEAIGDVTKQKDISGFYRHLYRQTVEKNDADLGIVPEQSNQNKMRDISVNNDIDKDGPIQTDSESEENKNSDDEKLKAILKNSGIIKKKRQYRSRIQETSETEIESESEDENNKTLTKNKMEEKQKRDLSETPTKKIKLLENVEYEKSEKHLISTNESVDKISNKPDKTSTDLITNSSIIDISNKKIKVDENKKVNIWEKRTIGLVFEAALQRYLVRKHERLSGY